MDETRPFILEQLDIFKSPLRQRLFDQAAWAISHPPDLLDMLDAEEFARKERENGYDPSHDYPHVLRVRAVAEKIALAENADLETVWAEVACHDLITYNKGKKRLAGQETDESAAYIGQLLLDMGFPKNKIPAVQQAIKESSFTKRKKYGTKASTKESQVLFDADKLDQSGATAIMRFCASSGRIGRQLYHPEDPACENRQPDVDRYGMDLCRARSYELNSMCYTDTAKKIAKRRNEYLKKFFRKLKLELVGLKEGDPVERPAIKIMDVFKQAGERKLRFYDLGDPFCEQGRPPEPDKYALDQLFSERPAGELRGFAREFVDELRLELEGS